MPTRYPFPADRCSLKAQKRVAPDDEVPNRPPPVPPPSSATMDYCCFATQQPFDDKDNLNALYIRQPYSHQVIQLVECAPPPREPYQPSRISSYVASSSSESSSSSSSSAPMSSSPDEDESESISSYCSSEQDAGSAPLPPSPPASRDPTIDDTYRVRMKRIHAWRDTLHPDDPSLLSSTYNSSPLASAFSHPLFSCTAESPLCPSRKRKVADDSDDDSHDESYPDTVRIFVFLCFVIIC